MARKKKHPLGESIREIIFGIEDGAVGNLGVVVGLAQAAAATKIILLGGFATMFAQAISMSAGTYLSIKSEKEYFSVRRRGRAFGREYSKHKNPVRSALTMAFAVIFGTAIPLIPFFFFEAYAGITWAIASTLLVLFLVGASKTRLTGRNWFKSGAEMLIIGVLASVAGYAIGTVFAI